MNGLNQDSAIQAGPVSESDEIELRNIVAAIIDGRWLICGILFASIALSVTYLWLATPVYRADAMVQVELQKKGLDAALGDLGEILGGGTIPISAELELIRSRLVLGRVVRALNLELGSQPRYFPLVGKAISRRFDSTQEKPLRPAPQGLDTFAWGGEKISVTRLDLPEGLLGIELTLRAGEENDFQLMLPNGEALLAGNIGEPSNSEDGNVSIFVQELLGRPGTEFLVWRNSEFDAVQALQKELQISEKGRLSGMISLVFEHHDPLLAKDVVNELVKAYRDQNIERRSAEAAKTLEFLDEQLPKLREQLETAGGALNRFRLQHGSADLTKETELVLQRSVEVETTRMQLEQKKEELLLRFTDNHPSVQAANAQLAQVGRERAGIDSRVRGLPDTQQELLRLSRDVQVSTELYTALLNNFQELQIAKAGTVGNVRIIDKAPKPARPDKPKSESILAIGAMLGLIFGVAAVYIRHAFRQGVHDPAQIERVLAIPTFAVVPFTNAERRLRQKGDSTGSSRLLVSRSPNDTAVESLRSLRTALHFSLASAENNVIMVTGPAPGVGKSFVSANLGALLAAGGKRVVVIDADLRRGVLQEQFGIDRAPGLSNFLIGDCDIDSVVRTSGIEGLSIVTSGALPPNPAELLLNERFVGLLRSLGESFDYVLVDTPPILAVADAGIVGALAGTSILVLKSAAHPIGAVEESVRRLRQANVKVNGVVLNQVQIRLRRYGYQYDYGYS